MSLQTAIYSELASVTAITDIVGDAIYAGRVPVAAGKKYIVYRKLSNTHESHLLAGAGLAQARVQVDCLAPKPNDADALYDEVRKALDDFQGTLGVVDSGDEIDVESCMLENDEEAYADPDDGSETGPCKVMMDFMIFYSESVVNNI